MRRVDWSETARADLRKAIVYLSDVDDRAALRLRSRIDESVAKLAGHSIGRRSRVSGLFEKPVSGTRYTIAYAMTADALLIVRVLHQRRDWPDEGWPPD